MKVIFLDIDGVFNSEKWYRERGDDIFYQHDREDREFDPDAVSIFNYLIDSTGASIVVSSMWRKGDLKYLQDLFEYVGINGDVVGETPRFSGEIRGNEIEAYLKSKSGIDRYIIIDDDSDMQSSQMKYFVKTSWKEGLTKECADKAIRILNNEKTNL